MDLPDGEGGDRRSAMRITGENVAAAIGIGFVAAVLIGLIAICARIFFDVMDNRPIVFPNVRDMIIAFPYFFVCIGPVVFIPVFALLQRTRLK